MRLFPTLALTAALAAGATAAALTIADPDSPEPPPGAEQAGVTAPDRGPRADPDDPHTWQTSDQVRGEIAAPLVPGQRRVTGRRLAFKERIVPGVTVARWDEDTSRGPVRYYVMRATWTAAGVSIDYAHGGKVRRTQTVSAMVGRTPSAVAGVNGDFFDIGDTGAPLGLGVERGSGLWKGVEDGWNASFYFGRRGKPHIAKLPIHVQVRERPELPVIHLNPPQVRLGAIGVYTKRWGRSAGYRWTDGQRRDVRLVHVVDGRVVANRTSDFPSGDRIKGQYLVARGPWASGQLRGLRVGDRAHIEASTTRRQPMVISGNVIVLQGGRVLTSDDGEMHPRTAVGIDRDKKQIIFLVVEGRQTFSRGYTMEEIARKLKALGAEDGLNLDGGGSTTLVAKRKGELRVVNSPSDGSQRSVPNGLEVLYQP